MPVRVCMVVNNLDVGGLEKVVLSLLRRLPSAEVEPSLVCLSGPGRLIDEVDLPHEDRLILDRPPELTRADKLRVPADMIRISRFFRDRRIDVVHAHNLAPLVYGGVASRLPGASRPAVIYSEHNQIYSAPAPLRRRFRHYVRLADVVVAVSHDLRRTLVDELRISREVRVLHNGIDPRAFTDIRDPRMRRELGARDGDFLVGTAVVLSEQKGVRYLIDAARTVRATDPTVRFVVAGDGPLRAELEQTVSSLGLDDGVRFIGYRRDVPRIIAGLDAYVLPSLWEGLPLALLEALASGTPIVATRVGGNAEVVEDQRNGFLVPPRDPHALATAVLRLRHDPELRERMRRNNLTKFASSFSEDTMVGAHAALYREFTSRQRGRRGPDERLNARFGAAS